MRYVARVIVVFPEGSVHPKEFDAWDTILTVQESTTRAALRSAVAITRSAFEHPVNRKVLGYVGKPILYVVTSISRHVPLSGGKPAGRDFGVVITGMTSLAQRDVQRLKQSTTFPFRCALSMSFGTSVKKAKSGNLQKICAR